MEALLLKCLQKNPKERYQNCAELIADLSQVAQGLMPKGSGRSAPRRRNSDRQAAPRQRQHQQQRSSSQSGPPLALIGGGGGLLAVVLVIALIALGGGEETTAPSQSKPESPPISDTQNEGTSPSPRVTAETNPEPELPRCCTCRASSGAEGMLKFAKEHFTKNPLDFAKSQDMFSRAQRAGINTPIEFKAEAELDKLEAAWKAYALTQWETFKDPIRREMESGLYDQALSGIAEFDATLATKIPDELNQLRSEITSAGQGAIAAILTTAQSRIDEGQLDAAQAELAKLPEIAYQEGLTLAQSSIEEIETAITSRTGHIESAAEAIWLESEGFFIDGLLSDDQSVLRQRAKELLSDSAHGAGHNRIQAVIAVADALSERNAFVQNHLRSKLNTEMNIKTDRDTVSGILRAVEENWLKIEITKRIDDTTATFQIPVRWSTITQEQYDTWLANWQPEGPDAQVANALLALKAFDADRAEAALNQAPNHPLLPSLRERVDEARLGAAEVAAKRKWEELVTEDIERLNEKSASGFFSSTRCF